MCGAGDPRMMNAGYKDVAGPLPPAPPKSVSTVLVDPNDFSDRYNTKLSPAEEKEFKKWAKENNKTKDVYDYDLRGFWKDKQEFADNGHGSDKYKKPNHPTFSDQSQYHGKEGNVGGKWAEKNGKVSFTPSETNIRNMSAEELKYYFQKYEPGVELNLPKGK